MEIIPVLMPTMPYSSASPTRRRDLNHGRRNRRQGQTRCHCLRDHIGFIFKTEQRGEGAELSSFDTLALAGTSTRMVGWKSYRRVRVLYHRKLRARLFPAIGNMLFHFCYRFFIDQRPDVTPLSSPSPICSLLTACCNFRQSGHTRRPARINGWRRRRLPGVAEFRGQCAFHGFIEIGTSKTINGALPPSSSDTFLMSSRTVPLTGGQFRSNR